MDSLSGFVFSRLKITTRLAHDSPIHYSLAWQFKCLWYLIWTLLCLTYLFQFRTLVSSAGHIFFFNEIASGFSGPARTRYTLVTHKHANYKLRRSESASGPELLTTSVSVEVFQSRSPVPGLRSSPKVKASIDGTISFSRSFETSRFYLVSLSLHRFSSANNVVTKKTVPNFMGNFRMLTLDPVWTIFKFARL